MVTGCIDWGQLSPATASWMIPPGPGEGCPVIFFHPFWTLPTEIFYDKKYKFVGGGYGPSHISLNTRVTPGCVVFFKNGWFGLWLPPPFWFSPEIAEGVPSDFRCVLGPLPGSRAWVSGNKWFGPGKSAGYQVNRRTPTAPRPPWVVRNESLPVPRLLCSAFDQPARMARYCDWGVAATGGVAVGNPWGRGPGSCWSPDVDNFNTGRS